MNISSELIKETTEKAELSLRKKFKKSIWCKFTKSINEYDLVQPNDKIAVCISGGKDSMLMAKLFQELKKHDKFPFEVVFLVMDPGYNEENRRKKQQDMRNCDNDIETYASEDILTDLEEVSSNVMGISNYRELYNDDILNALDQLKPQYKRALLYQQAGYKLKEIAEIEYRNGALESRNIETIKSRLFLARQTLQQLLTRDGKRRPTGETD